MSRATRIEWTFTSVAVLVFVLFFTSNLVFAESNNIIQCAPRPTCNKSMILASKQDVDQSTTLLAPVERHSPIWMEKAIIAPYSGKLRVAPLVTKGGKCCCNSDCSEKSNQCC